MLKLWPVAGLAPSPARASLERWSRHTTAVRGAVAVAFSGGADSTCLLLEEARLRMAVMGDMAGTSNRTVLHAFHVNHGMQAAAEDFERHGSAFCHELNRQWPTRFSCARIKVDLPQGASPESQARDARYDALAELALEHGVGMVLLAHHADDQVESMLLALTRGGGVAGLAGMSAEFTHRGVVFARPLLDVPGPALRAWLTQMQIPFVDDPSNADGRHARNRLRQLVLPALEQSAPSFRETFARSARLAHAAHQIVEERAADDLSFVGVPPSIRHLQGLSAARQTQTLRRWLRQHHATTGSEAQMNELVRVLAQCITRGHGIHLRVGRGFVERDGDHLRFEPSGA